MKKFGILCVVVIACVSCDSLDDFTTQNVLVPGDGTAGTEPMDAETGTNTMAVTSETDSVDDTSGTDSDDINDTDSAIWTDCNVAYEALVNGAAAPGESCSFDQPSICGVNIRFGTVSCIENSLQVACMTDSGLDTSWPPAEDRLCYIE